MIGKDFKPQKKNQFQFKFGLKIDMQKGNILNNILLYIVDFNSKSKCEYNNYIFDIIIIVNFTRRKQKRLIVITKRVEDVVINIIK